MNEKIVVCGAGGFVGGALVRLLLRSGFTNIRAVSSRPVADWIIVRDQVQNVSLDLRDYLNCQIATSDAKWVVNLAAKVGGVGYIEKNKLACLLSSEINTNLLRVAAENKSLGGYFFASSACVYGSTPGKIHEDMPLFPSAGYGEEKVFSEKMCRAFHEEAGVPVRIARFTGIYGPGDSIKGKEDRDHVPSALCRKVAQAKLSNKPEITIWGSGQQLRNFLYVDDCAQSILKILFSGCGSEPINVGSMETSTINNMVEILEEIAAVKLQRFYDLTAPTGVFTRQYCLDRLLNTLQWVPPTSLKDGLRATYNDIWDELVLKN